MTLLPLDVVIQRKSKRMITSAWEPRYLLVFFTNRKISQVVQPLVKKTNPQQQSTCHADPAIGSSTSLTALNLFKGGGSISDKDTEQACEILGPPYGGLRMT